MDEADSSDSDRSANRLCSFSTKVRCVVGSSSFSTAMGGEVYCGKEQRFKRSEQEAVVVGVVAAICAPIHSAVLDDVRHAWREMIVAITRGRTRLDGTM